MTTYEEIVAMLKDASNAGKVCGIGILVEFPLSRPRFESPGVLVVERGRRSKKPWKLRRVSMIILLKAEDSEIEPIRVSGIDWKNLTPIKDRESKGWKILIWARRKFLTIQNFLRRRIKDRESKGWKILIWVGRKFLAIQNFLRRRTFRENSELLEGYSFHCSNRVIKIDSYKDTFNYWYVKPNNHNSLKDIKSPISGFRSLCSKMEKSITMPLIDFGFLSPCEDLEWLELRFREHMPEPHRTKASTARKKAADNKINEIQAEKSKLERQIIFLENDLLEAKNEKRPHLRWLWKIVNSQTFVDIFNLIAVVVAILIAIFMLVLSSTVLSTKIGPALLLFWAVLFGYRKYYKRFSRPMSKLSTRYSRSEASRELTTEKHYSN